jgi:hypothetical protein
MEKSSPASKTKSQAQYQGVVVQETSQRTEETPERQQGLVSAR